MRSLFNELKRRNVIRVGIAYIVAAWLLLQVADVVINNIEAPEWVFQAILLVVALGFPFALIFAWAFELTPEGLKKEKDVDRSQSITHATGRKLDFAIIAVLVLALGYFAYDKFVVGGPADESAVALDDESTSTEIPEMSIAVLPFVNMSSDPEQEFFSDGISEELLNMLAQFPGLRVAARTSSFQFKGQNQDIGKIADTLNVAHVLEGSVRKAGTRLRITAQLIKADNGYHLWSDTYDRELTDIFAVQDEIAGAISEALKLKLALDNAANVARPETIKAANTEAYESFLRGRRLIHERGRAALEEAVRHLEQSLRLDNNFAPAHAQLAIATTLLLESPETYGDLSLEQVKRIAIPHLDRALELEPNLAEGFAGRALLALDTEDVSVAIEYARKALDANPSYIDAMNWLYLALGELGLYQEQLEIMDRILETDPLTRVGRANYIVTLGDRGKLDEGHRVAEELVEQNPWAGYAHHAALSAFYEADFAQGVTYGLQAYEVEPTDIFSNNALVQLFSWIGEYDEARRITDVLDADVDMYEGRYDDAIATTQRKLMFDPDNAAIIDDAANALYFAGRIEEALPLYERLRQFRPPDRPVNGSIVTTMRYAHALRITGDNEAAQSARNVAANDRDMLIKAGYVSWFTTGPGSMIAAFDHDTDGAITALEDAFEKGMRNPGFLRDPIFDEIRNDPRFLAVEKKIEADLARQHADVLQTICFHNPVPHAWRPLPETCDGVIQGTHL
jgi:TolB-like protein/tetratricopeptide (TPR) repeat protein